MQGPDKDDYPTILLVTGLFTAVSLIASVFIVPGSPVLCLVTALFGIAFGISAYEMYRMKGSA